MPRKAARPPSPPPQWRDRIIGFERIAARDLQGHEGNWRVHPQAQRDALSGVLAEVGIVDALLVYDSEAHGGRTILDGHLRHSLDAGHAWPCLVLDVDDAEAALLLATFDPITGMAESNAERLRSVLDTVQTGQVAVQSLLSALAVREGLMPPDFAPVGIDEQGRLDQQSQIECPSCGHTFTP